LGRYKETKRPANRMREAEGGAKTGEWDKGLLATQSTFLPGGKKNPQKRGGES